MRISHPIMLSNKVLLRQRLLSLNISLGTYNEFIEQIIDLAKNRLSSYVCVANAHMVIEAHKDHNFANVVNAADIVTPDGMPVAKGIGILYGIKQERVAGMDLLPDLLKETEKESVPVYFFGGTSEMLNISEQYLISQYPGLIIAGMYSPPFRKTTPEENQEIATIINDSNAGLVFVVLGCPKQEKWMAEMKGKVNACMIGIGGALPVLVGMQSRAPLWMQKSSLEWLYRLMQEPRRLFRRYSYTNSLFLVLLIKQFMKIKGQKGS